jgi:hypothetical protein
LRGPGGLRKKGDPKNEGMSNDVYENKGREISSNESETMLMKTKKLSVSCYDVDEKKGTCRFWGLGPGD